MRKLMCDRRGQFVIIAVLMIAVMIISIGALMHRAVTYYRHEPWEEYLALIGNVELNSKRLVELSLANYTHTLNQNILKNNLEKWETDALKIYHGRGVRINYELANRSYNIYGTNVNYMFGLNYSWYKQKSFSVANATFSLNLTSIGLSGYKFTAVAFLNLTIISINVNRINVTVKAEDKVPVFGLGKDNFQVIMASNNATIQILSVESFYDDRETLVYVIKCNQDISTAIYVKLCDSRGIQVIAKYPP
ncbi:hypothetical protein KEJ32_03470 [Candidatus Bathyarchaeota archaeon]|nr:hypothetical protein [Candidatus Bathyarchaeota archaeon]